MNKKELLILVGMLVQEELDRRIEQMSAEVSVLPFDGPTVIKWSTVARIVAQDFTHTIQENLKKSLEGRTIMT